MKVRWSRGADEDLAALVLYIAADNIEAALRVEDVIVEAAESLDRMPRRGRPGLMPGTRELVLVGAPYVLVYEVGDGEVRIMRVRHGARDWPSDRKP